MTSPLLLPSGAVVRVAIPGPPVIVAAVPALDSVIVVPTPGPVGPPGVPGEGARVINEIPSGTKDGVNAVFTLANTPRTGSTTVYRNGLRETIGTCYFESGAVITFSVAPMSSDEITVDYLMEG